MRLFLSINKLPVNQYNCPKKGIHSKLFLPTVTVGGCTMFDAVTMS
ncbi:hypothetical protein SSMOSELEY_3993 [Shigella sonnei str. Moseley]|nr:hypothetical protein SSMOSELEY_3993 [Shigella sonnei str. Moseley]